MPALSMVERGGTEVGAVRPSNNLGVTREVNNLWTRASQISVCQGLNTSEGEKYFLKPGEPE